MRFVPDEVNLVKGMALRLSGNIPAATEVLRTVSRRSSSLHPSQRDLAIAWLIETQAVAGTETASLSQIKWLERKNRYIFHGGVGIILAALLRLTYVSDSEHRAQ